MRSSCALTGSRSLCASHSPSKILHRQYSFRSSPDNLIQIQNGTFYRQHPSSVSGQNKAINPAYFPNLTFSLPSTPISDVGKAIRKSQHWAVIGANDTTAFLDVLRGSLLCLPPRARTFPYLSTDEVVRKDPRLSLPSRAIQYVGFNAKSSGSGAAGAGVQGPYLSARYESRREETDWTVLQYLKGDTELNPSKELSEVLQDDDKLLLQVVKDLKLEKLLTMPVSNLSNGQTRRSRIAKALLSRPELLLLDEPFMGLDPPTLVRLSPMLRDLAWRSSPLLTLALRPQDPVPDWISHLILLGGKKDVVMMGEKNEVLFGAKRWADLYNQGGVDAAGETWLRLMEDSHGKPLSGLGDSLTESGIRPFHFCEDMDKYENKYFEGSMVRPRTLSLERQKLWEAVKSKTSSERNLHDWMTLMTSLPADFESMPQDNPTSNILSAKSSRKTLATHVSADKSSNRKLGDPLIEFQGLVLKYGDKTVIGHPPPQPGFTEPGLNMTIRKGSRIALLGPNGSGKTTVLSLLTSDHPQSYSLPIKFFGRERLPSIGKSGLSLWEIQSRIGHSSPEVHAFFPKHMTIRRVLESTWAETFSSRPELTHERTDIVDNVLQHFEAELKQVEVQERSSRHDETSVAGISKDNAFDTGTTTAKDNVSWATSKQHPFGNLSFGTQRLLLLLRALIKQPSIIILDEAFSGLSPTTRDKAMAFLHDGIPDRVPGLTDQQALVVVSHLREEIPDSIEEWIRLPSEEEATGLGKAVETGSVDRRDQTSASIKSVEGWNQVWGL